MRNNEAGEGANIEADFALTVSEFENQFNDVMLERINENDDELDNAEVEIDFAFAAGDESEDPNWWIDSGASRHMTENKDDFHVYKELKDPVRINLADNSVLLGIGVGDITLKIYDVSQAFTVKLTDVLHVPNIQRKLLSLPTLLQKGIEVRFINEECIMVIDGVERNIGRKHGKLFKLNTSPHEICSIATTTRSPEIWHNRYGHLSYENLKLVRNMVEGIDFDQRDIVYFDGHCEGCIFGKHSNFPFPKISSTKSTQTLELVHSDVCGPMSIQSIGGSRYVMLIIDDYSRYIMAYILKHKSDAFQRFKEFATLVENQFGRRIKKLWSDNGGEYVSNEFRNYLKSVGIAYEETIPYCPQQNGVAERSNRTIIEVARSMLYHAHLPLRFWAEAVATAVYIRNRSPTSCIKGATPFERWTRKLPNVENLRVFGCTAYAKIPDEKRKKLDAKSLKCVFVGYPEGKKGYKLYNPATRKMITSRDVIFAESEFEYRGVTENEPDELLPEMWFKMNITDNENVENSNIGEAEDVDNIAN